MLDLLHMPNGGCGLLAPPELDLCADQVATSPALERLYGGQRESLGNTNERATRGRVTQHMYNSTDCWLSEHDIA